jgi:hypothetical protein
MSIVIAWIVTAILTLVFGFLLAETIAMGRFSASGRTVIWSENRLGFCFAILSLASCPSLIIGALCFGRDEDKGLLIFAAAFFVMGCFIGSLKKSKIGRAGFAAKQEASSNTCFHPVQEYPMNNVDSKD